jgi:hypothetical protein
MHTAFTNLRSVIHLQTDDKKAEWHETELARKGSIERSETATSTSSFDEVTVTLPADEPPDHTAGFREVSVPWKFLGIP